MYVRASAFFKDSITYFKLDQKQLVHQKEINRDETQECGAVLCISSAATRGKTAKKADLHTIYK